MKAIVQHHYGSTDTLRLEDIPKPTPGDNDVLVNVKAAGVDASVWHLMTGRPTLVRLFAGIRAPKIRVRGYDLAGTVSAVGRNVTRFVPGDEVFGTSPSGSYAEFTSTTEKRLVSKPASLTFEQASAVPVSSCAALHALRDVGKVQAGQHVLIIGAGGGVGSFAVQLAKAFGATVTGVCSSGKVDLVRSLGADHVVDYTRDDFAAGGQRYDLILDIAGADSLSRLRGVVTHRGMLVIVGGEGGGRVFGGLGRQLRASLWSIFISQRMRSYLSSEHAEDLAVISDLIEAGSVTPAIERTYPLGEAAEAIDRQHAGHVGGKLVLVI